MVKFNFPTPSSKRFRRKKVRILTELIESLGTRITREGSPDRAYWTAVVSRVMRLASTFRDEGHPHQKGVKDVGRLTEKSALELANYSLSDYAMEASIGMAAINSLIEVDEQRCVEKNASRILIENGEAKTWALSAISLYPELKRRARNLWVFEQRPKREIWVRNQPRRFCPGVILSALRGPFY